MTPSRPAMIAMKNNPNVIFDISPDMYAIVDTFGEAPKDNILAIAVDIETLIVIKNRHMTTHTNATVVLREIMSNWDLLPNH